MPEIHELINIVKEVSELLLKWRKAEIFEGKWVGTQFKAKADLMAHQELVERLNKVYPDIPIVSEESTFSMVDDRAKIYWLIDPIDGTASFVKGYPGFVTQVALMEGNRPKVSVICAPAIKETYIGVSGKGAYLNNKKISVPPKEIVETLIDNYPEPKGIAKKIHESLNVKKYIECGSIALKICKVASGNADIFVKDVIVSDWDLAAPQLILEETGGCLTDINGEKIKYFGSYQHPGLIVSRSRKVHDEIISLCAKFKREDR